MFRIGRFHRHLHRPLQSTAWQEVGIWRCIHRILYLTLVVSCSNILFIILIIFLPFTFFFAIQSAESNAAGTIFANPEDYTKHPLKRTWVLWFDNSQLDKASGKTWALIFTRFTLLLHRPAQRRSLLAVMWNRVSSTVFVPFLKKGSRTNALCCHGSEHEPNPSLFLLWRRFCGRGCWRWSTPLAQRSCSYLRSRLW